MQESQVSQTEEGLFDQFPEQVQEDVTGLLYLGHLEATVSQWGHTWVLRTLKGEEELLASLVCKDYTDTLGQAKAWAWANVCLALESVDGDSDFCLPIGPDQQTNAKARFRYCTSRWYWPVAEHLFREYVGLVERQVAAFSALRDLSERNRPTSLPSPDSSNEQGDSPTEIQALLD